MDIALCRANDHTYTAAEFSDLDLATLSTYRRSLVCRECGAESYFRRASRSGQSACFGARPHNEGCEVASALSPHEDGFLEDGDAFLNRGDRLALLLTATVPERKNVRPLPAATSGRGSATAHVRGAANTSSTSQIGLRNALMRLVRTAEFRRSRAILVLPTGAEWVVRDYFVRLDEAEGVPAGAERGYWGAIYQVKEDDKNNIWLNTRGRGNPNLLVPAAKRERLLADFNIDDIEDLNGAAILVIGVIHQGPVQRIIYLDGRHPFIIRKESQDAWAS
ncbi:hypothetical protein [Agromyces subbeticus]|uniref:hypothetical protein n=1 Tax=Agromyces subbeticus TaxID=293890 RepID=UPI0012EBC8F5|nr:hypothetical protein [Agromyces subbeticus]